MKWLRMRPVDITELDESARWHLQYGGGDEDEGATVETRGGGGPSNNGGIGHDQAQQVARRKKAPIRSRRRGVGTGVGVSGGGRVEGNVDTGGVVNGIADVG